MWRQNRPYKPFKQPLPKQLETLLLEHRHGIGLENLDSRFPQIAKLLDSCLILRRLVKKLKEVRHLNHHERLSLLFSVGQIPGEGEPFLHAAIGLCYDYDHAITQKFIRQKRPFPISCPRLREKHGDLLDGTLCNCFFRKMTKEAYPTPLLHVISMRELFPKKENSTPPNKKQKKKREKNHHTNKSTKKKNTPKKKASTKTPTPPKNKAPAETSNTKPKTKEAPKDSGERLHDLLYKLIAQRRHLRGIQRSIRRISSEMAEIFDQRGMDEFETEIGLLIRTKHKDGQWEWDIDI